MKILIAVDGSACKFDGVVMGSRGHSDIVNMVLGSVVTKVLAKCSDPGSPRSLRRARSWRSARSCSTSTPRRRASLA